MIEAILPLHLASPHESLEWTLITSQTDPRKPQRLSPYQLRSIWMRLWTFHPGRGWLIAPWPIQEPERYAHAAQYHCNLGRTQHYLQIGGPKMPWRLIALPAEGQKVLIMPIDRAKPDEDPVSITVSSSNQDAEALLGYLKTGAIGQARIVSDTVIAEDLLYGKRENPTAAAIGGYYLLRVGDLKRLHTWTNNLANWMTWLPDGAVIHAWHLLRMDEPQVDEARSRLLEASQRGLPVYTEGVRLLHDGLVMFDEDAKGQDEAVHQALTEVRRYAAAVNWTSPVTNFSGKSPLLPTREPPTGYPDDPDQVVFLHINVTLGDIEWLGLLPTLEGQDATSVLEAHLPSKSVDDLLVSQGRPLEELRKIARGEMSR